MDCPVCGSASPRADNPQSADRTAQHHSEKVTNAQGKAPMLTIDGAMGEGGGQFMRGRLALDERDGLVRAV